ncbi:hypothetical protein [uncultured Zoogloea sp.]|uniref:hypothetical protein n=1 Tax=uncultured Zoogloea sp. TaxID=160237 RepID=UPI00261E25B2|nr:hypothetical protein [uncultured Zoogloea sp.]
MRHLLTKWHPEDDPLSREQYDVLEGLVGELLTEAAVEGFLIVCSRFVDEFGGHRTAELARIFHTDKLEGKQALIRSLEHMRDWVGGMVGYERDYPVEIIPARPAFPQFRIVGIETLAPCLYRVLDSTRTVSGENKEPFIDFIARTRSLPAVPKQRRPVRRTKPNFHWCSYDAWATPHATREALQILPTWSDCRLRATVLTEDVRRSAYVAFNGDRHDPEDEKLRFYGYYYEPLAQEHPELPGGSVQIALEGGPRVHRLELFDEGAGVWREVFGPGVA